MNAPLMMWHPRPNQENVVRNPEPCSFAPAALQRLSGLRERRRDVDAYAYYASAIDGAGIRILTRERRYARCYSPPLLLMLAPRCVALRDYLVYSCDFAGIGDGGAVGEEFSGCARVDAEDLLEEGVVGFKVLDCCCLLAWLTRWGFGEGDLLSALTAAICCLIWSSRKVWDVGAIVGGIVEFVYEMGWGGRGGIGNSRCFDMPRVHDVTCARLIVKFAVTWVSRLRWELKRFLWSSWYQFLNWTIDSRSWF